MPRNYTILFVVALSTSTWGMTPEIKELTLGREFTALAGPSLTPRKILNNIAKNRGGEVVKHRHVGKWKLKDDEGFKWSAERDGRLIDEYVFEVQTPPLRAYQNLLMLVPLRALKESGAAPRYSVGGGHIHIDIEDKYKVHPMGFSFLKNPRMIASLINLLLNYEETLNFIFRNPKRVHTSRKLSVLRKDGKTLAENLGKRLNRYLKNNDQGCRGKLPQEFIDRHNSCIVALLEQFARQIVPTRETDINLQSWKGSSMKKTHGTLELRFFNAPKTETEVILEEKLVRAIADLAVKSYNTPIYYNPKVSPSEGENAYIVDYDLLKKDFKQLLSDLGLNDITDQYISTYLGENYSRLQKRRHPGN